MQAEEMELRTHKFLNFLTPQAYIHTSRHKYFHFVNCFLDTSKLNVLGFITMQAEEIYIHT